MLAHAAPIPPFVQERCREVSKAEPLAPLVTHDITDVAPEGQQQRGVDQLFIRAPINLLGIADTLGHVDVPGSVTAGSLSPLTGTGAPATGRVLNRSTSTPGRYSTGRSTHDFRMGDHPLLPTEARLINEYNGAVEEMKVANRKSLDATKAYKEIVEMRDPRKFVAILRDEIAHREFYEAYSKIGIKDKEISHFIKTAEQWGWGPLRPKTADYMAIWRKQLQLEKAEQLKQDKQLKQD